MKVLITGSAGHLGEALVRTLREAGHEPIGLDIQPAPFTSIVGSLADARVAEAAVRGADAVLHAAALHKPHIVTHTPREFVDTNVVGTLNLLEAAVASGVKAFVYTSTTSVFGRALTPAAGEPTAWITEDVVPLPKNIYGVTKKAAEDLCELFHRKHGLPCVVLRTSRFFPDEDDADAIRAAYDDRNVKVNEYLYRRVDLEDVVSAHLRAIERAASLGFGCYIVSATTPFVPDDAAQLRTDAPAVLARRFPSYEAEYGRRGWRMFCSIDRVYSNARARRELEWEPRWSFAHILERLRADEDMASALALAVGFKGYHAGTFAGGMYPTDPADEPSVHARKPEDKGR
ncbi:MAG TPA: NAD(P)-dependent oxidoreductase [Gammaproteobacteria bacterium]|nr:NAD(P)-dependent oxidoreductase [Gammaproteobacteria bacterium]